MRPIIKMGFMVFFFSTTGVTSTNYFLPLQKIFILAEVVSVRRSVAFISKHIFRLLYLSPAKALSVIMVL